MLERAMNCVFDCKGVSMKIFLDTANVQEIKKWMATGIIDGVTTNPTHMRNAGSDPRKVIGEICGSLPYGVVSVEVTEVDPEAVYHQARNIARLAENIAVKIPCDLRYYQVIRRLVQEDIQLNITLVFTVGQGLAMCKLGVAYISPFVGRLEDAQSNAGIQLVQDLVRMKHAYAFKTSVLAASIRTVEQMIRVIQVGADCVTLPAGILSQALTHHLTVSGIEKFLQDWNALGIARFP
jgi:transaldolase